MERQHESTVPVQRSRSVTDLLQETASHTENVVRGEIRLAVVKVQEHVTATTRRAVFKIVGGVLGFVAFVVLLVAATLRLTFWFAPWLATAIVGLLVALIALGLVLLPARLNGADS